MSSKEYKLKSSPPSKTVSLPALVIEKMSSAGENDLKAILYILEYYRKNPDIDSFDAESLNESFGDRGVDFASAIAFWRGAGVISACNAERPQNEAQKLEKSPCDTPKVIHKVVSGERPVYTSAQLAEAAEKDKSFKALADFVGCKLGRILNTSDLSLLYSFNDYLKLPHDVVMLAVEYCALEGKNSLRYVEKLLINFADKEIDTYDKAENYIVSLRRRKSFEGKIRKLCGLGERSLTPKEKEYLKEWSEKYSFGDDMVQLAYEKTIASIQKPSLSYMNTILKNWFEAGFKNPNDITQNNAGDSSGTSFDLNEFFEAAQSSSRKKIKSENT